MFNSHSRLHFEEVSYLNSLYTWLTLNFRHLIFNPPSKSFKGPTGRWIQKHSWHAIPKQNNRWWVSYTLQRREIVFTYHYEFTFTMKTKKIELFLLNGSKVLPHFRKAWSWNFYRRCRNMSSKIINNFSSISISKNNNLVIDFFGEAAEKHKQIDKTIIKQRYKLDWFMNRS